MAYASTEAVGVPLQNSDFPSVKGATFSGGNEILQDNLQLEDLGDGTNVYWSSTCEGQLKNYELEDPYPGMKRLPKLGTTIKFNAGLNVVTAKG